MKTTFDNNTIGFGMNFDNEENLTNQFCKRYRASIMQSKQEMIQMQDLTPVLRDLAEASQIYSQRVPAVDIRITMTQLNVLLHDFNEFSKIMQFFHSHPKEYNEYQKFLTWEGLKK